MGLGACREGVLWLHRLCRRWGGCSLLKGAGRGLCGLDAAMQSWACDLGQVGRASLGGGIVGTVGSEVGRGFARFGFPWRRGLGRRRHWNVKEKMLQKTSADTCVV